jgi:hypothetical protein
MMRKLWPCIGRRLFRCGRGVSGGSVYSFKRECPLSTLNPKFLRDIDKIGLCISYKGRPGV